jgi:hypothetical protein
MHAIIGNRMQLAPMPRNPPSARTATSMTRTPGATDHPAAATPGTVHKAAAEIRASGFKVVGPGGSQREVTYCLDRALNERLMAYMERSEAKGLPRRLRAGCLRRHRLATGF